MTNTTTFAFIRHGPREDLVYGPSHIMNPGLAALPFDDRSCALRNAHEALTDYVSAFESYEHVNIKTSPWLRCLQTASQLSDALRERGKKVSIDCDWAITENDDLCCGIPEQLIIDDYKRFYGKGCMPRGSKERQLKIEDGTIYVTHGGIIPQIFYSLNKKVQFGFKFYGGFVSHNGNYKVIPGVAYTGGGKYDTPQCMYKIDEETFLKTFMIDNVKLC